MYASTGEPMRAAAIEDEPPIERRLQERTRKARGQCAEVETHGAVCERAHAETRYARDRESPIEPYAPTVRAPEHGSAGNPCREQSGTRRGQHLDDRIAARAKGRADRGTRLDARAGGGSPEPQYAPIRRRARNRLAFASRARSGLVPRERARGARRRDAKLARRRRPAAIDTTRVDRSDGLFRGQATLVALGIVAGHREVESLRSRDVRDHCGPDAHLIGLGEANVHGRSVASSGSADVHAEPGSLRTRRRPPGDACRGRAGVPGAADRYEQPTDQPHPPARSKKHGGECCLTRSGCASLYVAPDSLGIVRRVVTSRPRRETAAPASTSAIDRSPYALPGRS